MSPGIRLSLHIETSHGALPIDISRQPHFGPYRLRPYFRRSIYYYSTTSRRQSWLLHGTLTASRRSMRVSLTATNHLLSRYPCRPRPRLEAPPAEAQSAPTAIQDTPARHTPRAARERPRRPCSQHRLFTQLVQTSRPQMPSAAHHRPPLLGPRKGRHLVLEIQNPRLSPRPSRFHTGTHSMQWQVQPDPPTR